MVFDQQMWRSVQQIMPTHVGLKNWAPHKIHQCESCAWNRIMHGSELSKPMDFRQLGINSPGRDGSRTAGTAGRVYPVALRNRIITPFDFLRETKPLISTVNPMFKIIISCIIILYVYIIIIIYIYIHTYKYT